MHRETHSPSYPPLLLKRVLLFQEKGQGMRCFLFIRHRHQRQSDYAGGGLQLVGVHQVR
jgi:hypothetical protein